MTTTATMHLDAADLDSLLLDRNAAERNESLAMLQELEATAAENARWAALDAQEADILARLAAEGDDE